MATLTKQLLPISGYTNQYYTYQCVVTENSYSVANNTSNVTVTFLIKGPWAPSFYEWSTNYGIIVDGSVKKTGSSSPYVSTSYIQLLTWTGDITHNSDGSKKINVDVYLHHNNTAKYLPKQYTSSSPLSMGSVTLTTIPRASSISSLTSSVAINGENKVTVNITRNSSSFTHTVQFYINNTYTTTITNVGTSTSYAIPTSWLSAMPSSTSCTAYCKVTTYNGSTQIGSVVSKNFTVTVPADVKPTVGSITLTPQTYANLIQGKNKLKIDVSGCSAGTGSGIKSYTFSGPGISSTTTNTSVTSSGTISNTGTLTYTVKVTDNRGRTNSGTKTITCYAWKAPSVKLTSVYRVKTSTSTTEDDSGTYALCKYNITCSSVNSTNDVTVKIYYKKNTASSWSSVTALSNSTETSGSYTLSGISVDSTYNVYAEITDNYSGSSKSSQVTIFSAERVLNIRPNGSGIALGKMAESNNLLDCKWAIKTDEPEQTMKNLTYKGSNLLSTTDDIMENWADMGNLATVYYSQTEKLNGQPAQYGYLLNITAGSGSTQVHQLWSQQPNGSLFHRGGNTNGLYDWKTIFDSSNYTNYVTQKPTQLFSSGGGTTGTITLSQSINDFSYIEIFYCDNNYRQRDSVKFARGNTNYITLHLIEPSTVGSDPRVYIRSSGWTLVDTTMTPGRSDLDGANQGVYAQLYPHANGTNIDAKVTANNYIVVYRILGYK